MFSINDISDGLEEMIILRVKFVFKLREIKIYNCNISEDEYDDNESIFIMEGELDFYLFCCFSINSEFDFVRSLWDNVDILDFIIIFFNGVELNEI